MADVTVIKCDGDIGMLKYILEHEGVYLYIYSEYKCVWTCACESDCMCSGFVCQPWS